MSPDSATLGDFGVDTPDAEVSPDTPTRAKGDRCIGITDDHTRCSQPPSRHGLCHAHQPDDGEDVDDVLTIHSDPRRLIRAHVWSAGQCRAMLVSRDERCTSSPRVFKITCRQHSPPEEYDLVAPDRDELQMELIEAGLQFVENRGGDGESPDNEGGCADDTSEDGKFYGVGSGRRKTLAAIEEQDHLDPIDEPDTLADLTSAVEDLSLRHDETDWWYKAPPEDVISTIEAVYEQLPDEAKEHYISDETLIRRINAARNQFNDWVGRLQRMKEMPSPVEAGPANYPAKKAKKRTESERSGNEDLQERVEKIEAGARGARQRALEAIGSSVSEQNEATRQSKRERMRERLAEGDLIEFRNPTLTLGEVVRVNKKTVTAQYPNPHAGGTKPMSDEPEPDYLESRVDLDSDFLVPVTEETVEQAEGDYNSMETARNLVTME